ncbi:MAG: hypothetical protein D6675_14975 [Gemmatimonadetes bacterium]|nr:MAG: hypothetical protein D6675_14975 [Gemmatimonadota bacterium]
MRQTTSKTGKIEPDIQTCFPILPATVRTVPTRIDSLTHPWVFQRLGTVAPEIHPLDQARATYSLEGDSVEVTLFEFDSLKTARHWISTLNDAGCQPDSTWGNGGFYDTFTIAFRDGVYGVHLQRFSRSDTGRIIMHQLAAKLDELLTRKDTL